MAEDVIAKTTGDPGITSLVESFGRWSAMAVWHSRHPGFAHELDLTLVENFKTSELHDSYRGGRLAVVADLRLLLRLHAGGVVGLRSHLPKQALRKTSSARARRKRTEHARLSERLFQEAVSGRTGRTQQ